MYSPQRSLVFADSPVAVVASNRLLKFNATGGVIIANLPAAAAFAGRTLIALKTDVSANGITITPSGGELINGAATFTLTSQYQVLAFFSDGTNWIIAYGGVGGGGAPSGPAGGDLAGTYPNPSVAAVTETSGPTQLVIGVIADGDFVKRVANTLVGATPSGGGGAVGDIIDDSGSTSDGYATVIDVVQADGLIGIGSIKNVLGSNSLTVRESVTDKFGVTTQIETDVPASGDYMFDLQTNFDNGSDPVSLPPYVSYTVEVKSTSAGNSTDYELHYIDITPTSGSGGGGSSDFEMSFSGTLSTVQDNLVPVKTKKSDVDVDQIDVELQEASAGQDVHIEVFSGVTSLGTCAVTAGALSGTLPITLTTIPANTRVSAKIRQIGTTTIAITASIFLRVA